jgi:hypothetical protein
MLRTSAVIARHAIGSGDFAAADWPGMQRFRHRLGDAGATLIAQLSHWGFPGGRFESGRSPTFFYEEVKIP